jgi:hypothetical protein
MSMKVTVQGWARDMGTKELADFSLSNISSTGERKVYPDRPTIYSSSVDVTVAWRQHMRYMGDYRMYIDFSRQDVLKLFKTTFGTELGAWLVDDEGFTISEELTRRALRTVKLSELTIADLAKMSAPTEEPKTKDKPTETATVRRFLRRV